MDLTAAAVNDHSVRSLHLTFRRILSLAFRIKPVNQKSLLFVGTQKYTYFYSIYNSSSEQVDLTAAAVNDHSVRCPQPTSRRILSSAFWVKLLNPKSPLYVGTQKYTYFCWIYSSKKSSEKVDPTAATVNARWVSLSTNPEDFEFWSLNIMHQSKITVVWW